MTTPDPRVLPLTLPTTCPDCLGPKPPEIVRCCSCQLYLDDPMEDVRRNRVALPAKTRGGSAGTIPGQRKLSTVSRALRRDRKPSINLDHQSPAWKAARALRATRERATRARRMNAQKARAAKKKQRATVVAEQSSKIALALD